VTHSVTLTQTGRADSLARFLQDSKQLNPSRTRDNAMNQEELKGKLSAAEAALSNWMVDAGYSGFTDAQCALLFATDDESIADCDGMLDDLEARVGVSESLLMALRWALHDYRSTFGKEAL
jgi:hypothetical protein